jgi:pSer/pThr/pTyr-binding forkhead associated (FHA) protein
MANKHVNFRIVAGPHPGDSIRLEFGSCRLIGRHLSEGETAGFDLQGHRLLDGSSLTAVTSYFEDVGASTSPASLSRGADVVLADDAISRAHAMIFFDQTGVGILDLASTNGTSVNGRTVSSAMLKSGDTIRMGHIEWVVD